MTAIPRVVISAPSSGHGKTAIAIGLLAAFAARGLRPAAFKIGPDYLDAAYLGLAAGRTGRHLDPQLVGQHRIGPLFAHGSARADIAVVEGTMGLYDGLSGRTDMTSTAQVAGQLRAPVVLVVDVAAMGQSVAALVHGFRAYDEVVWLGGVVLNQVASDRHEQLLREALDDIGVPVLGALRRRAMPIGLPARGHGVVPVVRHSLEARRAVRELGEAVTAAVDLDRVLVLARSAPQLTAEPWSARSELAGAGVPEEKITAVRPLIAVAGSERLTYGYQEHVELLRAAGAEIVAVDPLWDEALPPGVEALVIGGGLPETYLPELSTNHQLNAEVAALARAGRPVLAEGAGLAWLCRDLDGRPMCGAVEAAARSTDTLVLGYREATAPDDSVLVGAGTRVIGYKQHRTQVAPRAGSAPAWSWAPGRPEGFIRRGVHASLLALHWAGTPEIAHRVVRAAGRASLVDRTAGPVPVSPAPLAAVGSPAEPATTPIPFEPATTPIPFVPAAAAMSAGPASAGMSAGPAAASGPAPAPEPVV